jgi:hypothetical protein
LINRPPGREGIVAIGPRAALKAEQWLHRPATREDFPSVEPSSHGAKQKSRVAP